MYLSPCFCDGEPQALAAVHFPASPEFRGALPAVGLPEPRIEPLGDVERLRVADPAMPV